MRVLLISASPRFHGTCPGEDGKTLEIARAVGDYLGSDQLEVDFEDMSVKGNGLVVQPCKGCQSTAGGYHCHWPCDCYGPGSAGELLPDLMHDHDLYSRFEAADGFMILTPVNWHGPSTTVKALTDRMVCADKTLPVTTALRVFKNRKDPIETRAAYAAGELDDEIRNWLQGKVGAFFVHGDAGADEMSGRYPNAPGIASGYELTRPQVRDAVAHEVAAFQNMGVEIPEDLWVGAIAGEGLSYAENNDQFTAGSAEADSVTQQALTMAERLYIRLSQG